MSEGVLGCVNLLDSDTSPGNFWANARDVLSQTEAQQTKEKLY